MRNSLSLVGALGALGIALTSCGGGGGGSSSPTPSPPPPPPPVNVQSVEIVQKALLFTHSGQTKQLVARVLDTNGNAVDVPVTWSASTSGSAVSPQISVSAGGLATANTANGASQIVAEARGVKSLPLLAVVTPIPSGTILLTDSQIVGEPTAMDPNAPVDVDSPSQVILTNIAAPEPDDLLLNTEEKQVGGRVVSVSTSNGQHNVVVAPVPIRELVPELEINETVDLSRAPVTFPTAVLDEFTVTRTASGYEFDPRPRVQKSGYAALAAGEESFQCSDVNASIKGKTTINKKIRVDLNPSLDVQFTRADGLRRFVIISDPRFELDLTYERQFDAKATITCKLTLWEPEIPFAGVLGLFFSARFPVGAGIEFESNTTLATVGFSAAASLSGHAEFGIACSADAACDVVNELREFRTTFEPKLNLPSLNDVRAEPAVFLFAFMDLKVGVRKTNLAVELAAGRFGVRADTSFAPNISQALDASYQSKYSASWQADAGFGKHLKKYIEFHGFPKLATFQFKSKGQLAQSPFGVVRSTTPSFNLGDTVVLDVELNPESTKFLGFYNVDSVVVYRLGSGAMSRAATVQAAGEQTNFKVQFLATTTGTVSDYFVFVVTRIFPLDTLNLEIGRASSQLAEVYDIHVLCVGPSVEYVRQGSLNAPNPPAPTTRMAGICTSGAGGVGRHFTACRKDGVWIEKTEEQDDIIHSSRAERQGVYERDKFTVTADGTFGIEFAFGWDEPLETETQSIIYKHDELHRVQINPYSRASGGYFHRRVEHTRYSKRPNITDSYYGHLEEAELPYGVYADLPAFAGWSSWDPVTTTPRLVKYVDVTNAANMPVDCTGPSPFPYTQ